MKVGKYEESNKASEELIKRAEKLKDDFAEDYPIVASKFFVQLANIKFILQDYESAMEAGKKGVVLCKGIKDDDLEVMRSINNARRDLLNIILRSTVKLDPTQKSSELRKKLAEENELDITFMPKQDLMEIL